MSFNPDKTDIMIFSNRSIPENLDFSFNGKSVPIRERPFNLKGGGGYGFFLKKYSDSQCCLKKYSDFGGGKKK